MEKLIHNCSLPRSGSELLQVILHQNPRIYGSATSPLLEYLYAARGNYELAEVKAQDGSLMQSAFIKMCEAIARGYYQVITDRPVVCDKNRGWAHYYEWVDQWNPEPKMLCMVRDLRSVIASMERIYRANRHRPIGPDNPAALQNMTVAQRAKHWLDALPVGLALQRIADTFQRGLGDKIHWIKYEDLCNAPEATMQGVYEYLDEPVCKHNFDDLKKEVYEDCSHYGPYGNHSIKPKLTPTDPEAWREVLPMEVGDFITNKCRWYFNTFYQPEYL